MKFIYGLAIGFGLGALLVYLSRDPSSPQASSTINFPQKSVQQYKNDEKWEIRRDTNGAISSINVIRDAKVNG